MFKLSGIKKLKALSAALAASLMVTVMAPMTYADNGQAAKALNLMSYKYVDSTHLNLYFDKSLSGFVASQVKVLDPNNTALSFTATTTTGGCDWNCATPPSGTAEQLTFTNSLDPNTSYTVKVSSTVKSGNTAGINLGNYWKHNDIVFHFKTPDSNGDYQGTPVLTFIPGSFSDPNSVGASANVEVIADRPIDSTTVDLANEAYLLEDTDKNGSYETTVHVDTTFDTNIDASAQCYVSQLSKSGTVLFIPETCGGSTTGAYNLDDSSNFKFVIPDYMLDVSGNSFSGTDLTFNTGADTVAAWGSSAPSVTGHSSSSVSLSWTDLVGSSSNAGVTPNHYHVYYSTDPYWNYTLSTDAITDNGTTCTVTVTGLSSGTTYYFRAVGANSDGIEGGFSNSVSQATD